MWLPQRHDGRKGKHIGSNTLVPKVLHVDVLAQPRIEQYIPSGMEVILIHLNVVPVPTPVAAVINVVQRYDPCGMVVEYHPPSAVIHR